MKKILLNSELPISMLDRNNEVNDLDFVLFYLWEKYPEYKEFWLKNKKEHPERIVIFDNSAYEFYHGGDIFWEGGFVEAIKELEPTYYIIPDELMNKATTLYNFKKWKDIDGCKSKKMIVPQGKSFFEWISCYKEMCAIGDFDMIGIPFHNDFFYDLGLGIAMGDRRCTNTYRSTILHRCYEEDDKDYLYALGRSALLMYMADKDLVLKDKKYHLLGTHHWNEMKSIGYTSQIDSSIYNFIYSADTSYPVQRGIALKDLEVLSPKDNIPVTSFINKELDQETQTMILQNIKKFHSYVEVK